MQNTHAGRQAAQRLSQLLWRPLWRRRFKLTAAVVPRAEGMAAELVPIRIEAWGRGEAAKQEWDRAAAGAKVRAACFGGGAASGACLARPAC